MRNHAPVAFMAAVAMSAISGSTINDAILKHSRSRRKVRYKRRIEEMQDVRGHRYPWYVKQK